MNLPSYLLDFFTQHFTPSQVQVLNANWHKFSQLDLTDSNREQLLLEAYTVLKLCGQI